MRLKNPLLRISLFLSTLVVSFVLTLTIRVALGFKSQGMPVLVSLEPASGNSRKDPITIKLQWGGFYAAKEKNGYKVFRLLDINPNQYHIVTYDKVFEEVPNISEVSFLIPTDEHLSMTGVDILAQKLVLFGRRELSQNDLAPYRSYLESTGYDPNELVNQIDRVIKFSKEAPLETKLSDDDGLLKFEQAGIY